MVGACDGAAVIGDSDVGAAEGATDVGAAVIGDSDVGETVGEPVTGLAVVGFLVCSQLHRRFLADN